MTDGSTQVLVVGDSRAPEMRRAAAWVGRHFDVARVVRVGRVESALAQIAEQYWFPHLVVVCQNWPDEFSKHVVENLLAALPLSRVVCCFGAWCESDGRNRSIWPLGARVPARSCVPRLDHELAVLQGAASPLPSTASRDEIFEYDSPGILPATEPGLPVYMDSPDYELRRWIEDLCRAAGYVVLAQSERDAAVAAVWDVDPWNDETSAQLRDYCRRNLHAAVVALAGFAHPEDEVAIKQCGADAVVAKLSPQVDLLEAIAAAVSRRQKLIA